MSDYIPIVGIQPQISVRYLRNCSRLHMSLAASRGSETKIYHVRIEISRQAQTKLYTTNKETKRLVSQISSLNKITAFASTTLNLQVCGNLQLHISNLCRSISSAVKCMQDIYNHAYYNLYISAYNNRSNAKK